MPISFPISPERALDLIKGAVKAKLISIPDPPDGGEWYRMVTMRQVWKCLDEGDVIGSPDIDEYGNVQCMMERFGAGQLVRLQLVLEMQNDSWSVRVLNVENRL